MVGHRPLEANILVRIQAWQFVMRFCIIILIILCSCGCSIQSRSSSAPPIINWSNFDYNGLIKWQLLAAKKLGRMPIVLACHSGYSDDGRWFLSPNGLSPIPVGTIVDLLHSVAPDTPIILIVCNNNHARLTTSNVFYPDNFV